MITKDNRHLSEEEADAEIERIQQKITLALQQIDENFATCNQIVTSKIGTGIDQYGESSHQVWDFSKTWLYFFNTMNSETATYNVQDDESDYSTNRPAFEESSTGSGYRMNHNISANDITNLTGRQGLIRNRFRQSTSGSSIETTTEDNRLRRVFTPVGTSASMSSGSSASRRDDMSPPHTVPFDLPPSSLQGTPIREQAKALANHTLRQVGIHSSESESSDSKRARHRLPPPAPPKDKESYARAWGESNMDKDDAESRAKFNEFLKKRQHRLEDMPEGEELQPVRPPVNSPSNRTPFRYQQIQQKQQQQEEEPMLVGTPTVERVLAIKQKDLRVNKTPTTNDDRVRKGRGISDFDLDMEENASTREPSPSRSFHINSSLTPLYDSQQQQKDDIGAFEFSNTLPNTNNPGDQRNSLFGTPSSTRTGGSEMTMMQGQYTSTVPAHFDLHYFPEKFRVPPGSVMLTKVYHEFNDRPGEMLTVKDITQHINDQGYTEEYVTILISLLTRKKYLRKVGNNDAWVIRR